MATGGPAAGARIRAARIEARRAAVRTPSTKQRVLFVTALLTFGLASLYTCVALLAHVSPALFPGKNILNLAPFTPLESLGVTLPAATSAFNRRINILVMGIDGDAGNGFGAGFAPSNTDTIMVASIDPVSKRMSVLSIPRDLWVNINFPTGTITQNRIDASWEFGVVRGGSLAGGGAQIERDLRIDFGINVNYWVVINFKGGEQLINALGGVTIDVPPNLAVPPSWYSDDDIHRELIQMPAGVQHLNGYNAVAFARYRTGSSDLVRIKRQDIVLKAAMSKLLSSGLLNNPIGLWNAYNSLVRTNIPEGKLPGYALLLKDASPNLQTYSLGDSVNGVATVWPWVTPGGADVLLWSQQNVQYWIDQAFPNPAYADSHVVIQNAEGVPVAATEQRLGSYLEAKGLDNVGVGPSSRRVRGQTQIEVYGSSWVGLGDQIAQWLRLPQSAVTVKAPEAGSMTAVIKLGKSFVLPSAGT